jgi:hypothetical protein
VIRYAVERLEYSMSTKQVCGARWCSRNSSKADGGDSRRVGGTDLCRPCYQYVWEQANAKGISMENAFSSVDPPKRAPEPVRTKCARTGCRTVFKKGQRNHQAPKGRRHIGLVHICRSCYQAAWERAKARSISMEEAFKILPPKTW